MMTSASRAGVVLGVLAGQTRALDRLPRSIDGFVELEEVRHELAGFSRLRPPECHQVNQD
jgi:hypothetical protein